MSAINNHNLGLRNMSKTKNITRREAIAGATSVLGAAILPSSARAQSDEAAANAFYANQKYTYCDAKVLANFWSGTTNGNAIWDAKIGAGQMILNRQSRQLNEKLRFAADAWSRSGQSCSFEDADNPPYSYEDAERLARYWNAAWGQNMTPYDAKLKIALNIQGGGNSWVLEELAKARR